jgi:hypothetical protein
MAVLADFFDRIGRYGSAAMLSGFATTSFASSYFPETEVATAHLRKVLGEDIYTGLADRGRSMTGVAMATYALEQIDLARGSLSGEST